MAGKEWENVDEGNGRGDNAVLHLKNGNRSASRCFSYEFHPLNQTFNIFYDRKPFL